MTTLKHAIFHDTRDNSTKHNVDRRRYMERHRKYIKDQLQEHFDNADIQDLDDLKGVDIPMPKDLSEPYIVHDQGTGRRNKVHPGNKPFKQGDKIPKPPSGGGGAPGEGDPSKDGEGRDEYMWISQEEYWDMLFDGLELPNMDKVGLTDSTETIRERDGFATQGQQAQMDINRSVKEKKKRVIASGGMSHFRELIELYQKKFGLLATYHNDAQNVHDAVMDKKMTAKVRAKRLEESYNELAETLDEEQKTQIKGQSLDIDEQIAELEGKSTLRFKWDKSDLRYRNYEQIPKKVSQAVMFCLMDVSGSMTQDHKNIAKLFYLRLYKFLRHNYDNVDVVFLAHHSIAKEVDEQEFFYGQESGGTVVSSVLELMQDIKGERYPEDRWNIYGAQASDGDVWGDADATACTDLLENMINDLRGFYYTEIAPHRHQQLWYEYKDFAEKHSDKFWMDEIHAPGEIDNVFRNLFKKRENKASAFAPQMDI